MKYKYRIGTTEIIASIAGVILFILLYWACGGVQGAARSGIFSYLFPGVWLLSAIAIIFGPVAGMFVAVCGIVMAQLLIDGTIGVSWVIANIVFALFISFFADKFRVRDVVFTWRDAIDFNIAQITANILSGCLLMPLLSMFIDKEPFQKTVFAGFKACVGNSVGIAIVTTGVLYAVSVIFDRLRPKEQTSNPWLRKIDN